MKPDVLFLTFPRSGSTSLHETLKQHPDICLPLNKETWYFSRNYAEGESWYRDRFWHCKNSKAPKRTAEISTEALLKDEYLERVGETLPAAKIVVVLRDPVERTVSHYYHSVREGFETRPIENVLRGNGESEWSCKEKNTYENETIYKYGYLSFSLRYRASIETLLQLYDREHIKFILFEELIKEPEKVLFELQSFMQVEPLPLSLKQEHTAGIPRGKAIRFITGLPFVLYRGLNRSRWLDKRVPIEQKQKTRALRSRMLALLKKFAERGNKKCRKPPLNEKLRANLTTCFNRELKGIEKITGLPTAEYWPWYRP